MASLLSVIVAVGLLVVGGSAPAAATAAATAARAGDLAGFVGAADYAASYHASYAAQPDGSVKVTQKLRWDFGNEPKRGIFRTVRLVADYPPDQSKVRYFALSNVTASSPSGAPAQTQVTTRGSDAVIRIGVPAVTVTGPQDYVVSFTLANLIIPSSNDFAEFTFDHIDAASNTYAYRKVTADVTGPVLSNFIGCNFVSSRPRTLCGESGSSGTTTTFTTPDVERGEGVQLTVRWPRSTFGALTHQVVERPAADQGSGGVSEPPGRLGIRVDTPGESVLLWIFLGIVAIFVVVAVVVRVKNMIVIGGALTHDARRLMGTEQTERTDLRDVADGFALSSRSSRHDSSWSGSSGSSSSSSGFSSSSSSGSSNSSGSGGGSW